MYVPSGGYPDLATIRSWVQVSATVVDDAQLGMVAGAEQAQQARLDWGSTVEAPMDIPDDIYQAFLRRVARHLATKGIPLGIMAADAEYGVVRIARWDWEIQRLEAPYFVPVTA